MVYHTGISAQVKRTDSKIYPHLYLPRQHNHVQRSITHVYLPSSQEHILWTITNLTLHLLRQQRLIQLRRYYTDNAEFLSSINLDYVRVIGQMGLHTQVVTAHLAPIESTSYDEGTCAYVTQPDSTNYHTSPTAHVTRTGSKTSRQKSLTSFRFTN